jgi:hypothetical protein
MAQTVHTREEVSTTGSFAAISVVRIVLTLGASAALVIAMFQTWINGADGDSLAFGAYWQMHPATDVNFWRSAALVPLGCAILGVVGLVTLSGWLTRLAGAIAIVAFGLIIVELVRMDATFPDAIGAGLWWMLAGGLVMLIGSLFTPSADTANSV